MTSNDPQPHVGDATVPLDPQKTFHVFTAGALTGPLRELEARRFIWILAIDSSISMLRVALRARSWLLAGAPRRNLEGEGFPTLMDGGDVMRGMAEIAVIKFLTVFKSGRALAGDVAANHIAEVRDFRAQCVATAFPNAADRAAFEALLERLEAARDGLIAHADGNAQRMEFAGSLVSFGPKDNGVSPQDAAFLLECALKLRGVVVASRFA